MFYFISWTAFCYFQEIDPNIGYNELPDEFFDALDGDTRVAKNIMQELLNAFPGIDEAMSYAEVMKYVMFRSKSW